VIGLEKQNENSKLETGQFLVSTSMLFFVTSKRKKGRAGKEAKAKDLRYEYGAPSRGREVLEFLCPSQF
jgi:hypothetical protein